MGKPNLQTVIVSKDIAATRTRATKVAREYANRIYTSRETETSWRFRQRPPTDFVKGSFRTFSIPGEKGISLVYGKLKRGKVKTKRKVKAVKRNPESEHSWKWPASGLSAEKTMPTSLLATMTTVPLDKMAREDRRYINGLKVDIEARGVINPIQITPHGTVWDGHHRIIAAQELGIEDLPVVKVAGNPSTLTQTRRWKRYLERAEGAKNLNDLGKLAAKGREWMPDERLLYVFESAVAKRATEFGLKCNLERVDSVKSCVDKLVEGQQLSMFDNPRKRTVLKRPRVMPDPGPCAWLGGLLEWAWDGNGGEYLWEPPNGGEWIFLWSPELKAVVGVPMPRSKKRLTKVSRKAGGAKMFERFSARDAENTYEIDLPGVNLKKLGPAQHIVYRSDKWNPGEDTDYIHEFGKGVEIYVGPSLARPKVFLCFGGKLTATERGLVY